MKSLITILTLFFCIGCVSNQSEQLPSEEVVIYGNQVNEYISNEKSRSVSYLPEGSQASLFAQGYVEANGSILTLNNNFWKCSETLIPDKSQSHSTITAYCPPLPQKAIDLYQTDGQLSDLLIAQTTCPSNQQIILNFSHLFSKIIFQAEQELNTRIHTFICTIIPQITEIDPFHAVIQTDYNSSYIIEQPANSTGSYSVIVPSVKGVIIDIKIETNDGNILTTKLSNLNCEKGNAYTCSVKEKKNKIGIYTAEDFIAFSHLINNLKYKNRSLNEFGTTSNGITTFYLRNDIHLSESERKQVKPIGYTLMGQESKFFNDIFDGQGHFIDNLYIKTNNVIISSLFQYVGSTGVIKNLTLKHAEGFKGSYNDAIGILCGENKGTIHNCRIENSTLDASTGRAAGLSIFNEGLVINCSVNGLSVKNKSKNNRSIDLGGISKYNTGQIINCYTYNISVDNKKQKSYESSAICHVNDGTISNCYTDYVDQKLSPLCGRNNSRINNCYYPLYCERNNMNGDGVSAADLKKNQIYSFKSTEESKTNMCNGLNYWITHTAPQIYPNSSFFHWKLANDLTVTFVNP